MLSPIQTRRHWVQAITFAVEEQAVEECDYQFSISLKHSKQEDCWHVRVRVIFKGKDDAVVNYRGQIEYEGLFDVHPDFDEAKVDDLVRMNGGAILYGAIREHVLGLTARSKHGPFELPTIDARMFLRNPESAPNNAKDAETADGLDKMFKKVSEEGKYEGDFKGETR